MTLRRTPLAPALLLLSLLALIAPLAAGAQEEPLCPCPPPEPPPPLWTGSLGLSYLATTGNSETETAGFTTAWSRQPTPWGVDIAASADYAESEGVTTAERYYAGVRGKRRMTERFDLFAGFSFESNEFAGFDLRTIVEAGAIFRALLGPVHELAFDVGLTWKQEDFVVTETTSSMGAVAGLAYAWHISENAKLSERLAWYPDFDDSDDWRIDSETSIEAALAASWAIRASYLYQRDNQPPPGFEETDTRTSVSIVWKR